MPRAPEVALTMILAMGLVAPAAAVEGEVDVELVLAVDVSRSMDAEEFALQRAGYVEALRHPDFVKAVEAGQLGRIAVTYFEWAGTIRSDSVVEWRMIDGAASASAFADELAARDFNGQRGTSISGALSYGASLFDGNGFEGWRKVIDISGDGPNNVGEPVTLARDDAVARGIVVNGLPILVRPSPTYAHLDRYYAECVTGGAGSFVLPIRISSEFATAIRRKLIMEVSGAEPEPQILKVQAAPPVDCLAGERDRRFFSDPYLPQPGR